MEELIRLRPSFTQQNEEQRIARKRMALFPHAAEVLFVAPDVWVVRVPSYPIPSFSHSLSPLYDSRENSACSQASPPSSKKC